MKRISIYLCLISALLLLGAGEATPQQKVTTGDVSNPFVGTWVLNLDKSSDNIPVNVKGNIVKIEAQDNGLKFKIDWIGTERNIIRQEWLPKYDGKFYPVIGSTDEVSSLRRINTNSFEQVTKKYSEEAGRNVVVISEDGMTSTMTVKNKNSEGQEVTLILVYDKQED